jgi:ribosomal-protein-alanine N-acetyltransferase
MIVSRKPSSETAELFRQLPVIETDRLRLRPMKSADAADLFAYAADPAISRYTVWDHHTSIEDSRRFLNCVQQNYREGRLENWGIADKVSDRLIGTIGFYSWDPDHAKAEMHYALSMNYAGRGLMSEAVQAVLRFGFERMGLNRIQANCMLENIGSERVMQKNGMTFEGIMREGVFAKGRYYDLKTYAILKRDWEKLKQQ